MHGKNSWSLNKQQIYMEHFLQLRQRSKLVDKPARSKQVKSTEQKKGLPFKWGGGWGVEILQKVKKSF